MSRCQRPSVKDPRYFAVGDGRAKKKKKKYNQYDEYAEAKVVSALVLNVVMSYCMVPWDVRRTSFICLTNQYLADGDAELNQYDEPTTTSRR